MRLSLRTLRRTAAAIIAGTVAAAVIASCRGESATAPSAGPSAIAAAPAAGQQQLLGLPLGDVPLIGGLAQGLLSCNVTRSYSASQTIGSAGGVLKVGPHTLVVPKGALAANTLISASAPSGGTVQVHFEPSGLRFATPTALTMSYQDCGLVQGLLVKVVYVDSRSNILEVLTSLPNLLDRTVTAPVSHFSNYALAE